MPCVSDYQEQSGQELESIRVCKHIIYLSSKLDLSVKTWIEDAAEEYYGNVDRLNEATKILCCLLRGLTEEEMEAIVYDAHTVPARRLAGWWELHQEWDTRRVKEEDKSRRTIMLQQRALKKLTVDEIKALGLNKDV